MPVAAARLADVGAADADPAVVLRCGEHVGEKLAVGLLDEGALGEGTVGLGETGREGVADLLQLAEVEHARRPGGADPVGHLDPPEPLGDQPGELQFELADLPAQLGAREPLVGPQPSSFCRPLGDKRRRVRLQPVRLPFKQIRHEQILSRFEGRGGNP